MHSRTILGAVLFGLAVAACVPVSLALARTHHPGAAKGIVAPPYEPGLPPYPAGDAQSAVQPSSGDAPPTGVAGELAKWIAAGDDNGALPFMIIDKLGARIYVFDAASAFLGSAPVLIGMARGDAAAPEIRGLGLSQISPDQRTTPAGRFVTRWGPSDRHEVMLWVDPIDGISMHPMMSVSAAEHRAQRIVSSDPNDHRISYGCINLPKTFYDKVVLTVLKGGNAVVYVMPDSKPIAAVFPAFAAAGPASPPTTTASNVDAAARVSEPTRLGPVGDRTLIDPPK